MFNAIFKKQVRKTRGGCEGSRRGNSLIVRCDGCLHESDLDDCDCIKNLSRLLMDQSDIKRLILRRGIDKEYQGDALTSLKELSKLSSACINLNKVSAGLKECRDCKVNPDIIFGAIWKTMPDPVTLTARSILSKVEHKDGRCHRCVRNSLENLDRIDFLHQAAAAKINRLAYHVLEV